MSRVTIAMAGLETLTNLKDGGELILPSELLCTPKNPVASVNDLVEMLGNVNLSGKATLV